MASESHSGLSEAVGGPEEDERDRLGRKDSGAGRDELNVACNSCIVVPVLICCVCCVFLGV